jgi:hypothetical protein
MKGWLKFCAVPTNRWDAENPLRFEINPMYAIQEENKKR